MDDYRPHMLPKVRSERIMSEMEGEHCTLRIASFIPGERCWSRDTVVGVHLDVLGKGMSTKATDIGVVAGCGLCHLLQERKDPRIEWIEKQYPIAVTLRYVSALIETHTMLIEKGVISVKDGRLI